jgi:hypothetical protein
LNNAIAKTVEKARFAAAIASKEVATATHHIAAYLRFGIAIAKKVLLSKPGLTALALAAATATSGIYNIVTRVAELALVSAVTVTFGAVKLLYRGVAKVGHILRGGISKTLSLFGAKGVAAKINAWTETLKKSDNAICAVIDKADDSVCAAIEFTFNAWRSKTVRYPIMGASVLTIAGIVSNWLFAGAVGNAFAAYGLMGLAALVSGGIGSLLAFSAIIMMILGAGLAAHTAVAAISYFSVEKAQAVKGTDAQEQIDMLRLTMDEYIARIAKLEDAFAKSFASLSDALVLKTRVNGSIA